VAQGIGPEFKPQSEKQKTTKTTTTTTKPHLSLGTTTTYNLIFPFSTLSPNKFRKSLSSLTRRWPLDFLSITCPF
jgi:hypothetical protein